MKLSVSVPDRDVVFLDRYIERRRLPSRSAAIQEAIDHLRTVGLGDDYAAAWQEWEASGESAVWEAIAGDGAEG